MRRWFLRVAWRGLYPVLRAWLEERALRLPSVTRQWIARRVGVDEACVEAVEEALRERVLRELERFEL